MAGAAARVERMVGQKLQLNPEQLHELRDSSRADAEFQVRSALLLMEVGKKLGTLRSARRKSPLRWRSRPHGRRASRRGAYHV